MVKHLPPTIKHLLTLRRPQSLPSPPVRKLNDLFLRTFRDAEQRNAQTGWLVLTTCALLTVNRPASVGHLYQFVTNTSRDSRDNVAAAANKAALMRESALKSTIFVGVPRVILSLAALHEALDDDVKQTLRTYSRSITLLTRDISFHRETFPFFSTGLLNQETLNRRLSGVKRCGKSIYAPHADKLHDKLGSYHPDFISFIIQAYGSVLSPLPGGTKAFSCGTSIEDPDQGNLSRALGSVVGIATLRSEERVGPQLISHTFGLLKARHEMEGQSEEDKWLSSDEGTEWVIRTVDEILDTVASDSEAEPQAKL